jgi:hypothetical protein
LLKDTNSLPQGILTGEKVAGPAPVSVGRRRSEILERSSPFGGGRGTFGIEVAGVLPHERRVSVHHHRLVDKELPADGDPFVDRQYPKFGSYLDEHFVKLAHAAGGLFGLARGRRLARGEVRFGHGAER